jgi:hypothetical protein
MRRTLICTVTALSFALVPFMMGCEDTVSKKSETKVKDDGTVIKKEDKVTRNSDGSVTRTQSTDVDKPADKDHDVKVKIDTK